MAQTFLRCISAVLCVVSVLLVGCSKQATAKIIPTQTDVQPTIIPATPTPLPSTNLPSFSDWRAAYMAPDGLLHAVTLDGKTDVTGPRIPGLLIPALSFGSAGISADGRTFAHFANGVDVIDVSGGPASRHFDRPGAVYDAYWSQDGRQIIMMELGEGLFVINSLSGAPMLVPGGSFSSESELFGWIDATHVALGGFDPNTVIKLPSGDSYSTTFLLYALNITTGKLRRIASFPNLGNSFAFVKLSTDGKRALFYNGAFRDYLFTPKAFAVDLESGAMAPLPHIARILGYTFSSTAWEPGTQNIAVTQGFLINGDLQILMLDLAHDTVTKIAGKMYVEQWSPDGKTLIGSTGQDRAIGEGPSEISAMTFDATGQPTITSLTKDAMTFPFIGFVRTAP